jgi:aminopeptidase N
MTQSREVLAVMDAHTTTFGRKRGCTISRCGAFLLGAFFLICLVATGLLVYHFAPCLEAKQAKQCDDFLNSSLLRTGKSFSGISTKKKIDVRLPKAIVPDSYELWLTPFIWEGNFTFHGEVTFRI